MRVFGVLVLGLAATLMTVGCGGETKKDKSPPTDDHANHDHIGGNNPHKIELKDAPFNAKWAHAGELVTITIVDNDYKKEVAIGATELVVSDKGNKNSFKLPPLKKNEKGEASVFELADKKLKLIMDHEPTLTVKVGDKTYTATIIHIH